MAGLSERQPQEQPGQKPPRKGIAKILGRGQRNPFSNMTPTDAQPTPGYSPLTGTDRTSADSLHKIAAEARARVEANSADAADTIDTSSPSSGFWDRRVSKKAAVIAGSVIALVGAAGLGAEAVVVNNGSNSDKATTTDAGDSANPTPPSLTTPDGKNVVIPGTSATSGTASSIATETHATPTPDKPKTVEWTADQIAKAQQDALSNNKIAFLDTWSTDGGVVEDVKNVVNKPSIGLLYDVKPGGKVFKSPITGTVTHIAISVSANDVKTRTIYVQVGGIEVEFLTDFDSNVEVKVDQKITAGTTPLITLSGNLIPDGKFSKPAQIIIADVTNFTSTSRDVLRDQNGTDAILQTK